MRRLLAPCVATLLICASASALPTVRKYPVGPWVSNDAGVYSVPAGQPIDWLVRVCNDTARPLTAQVSDFVHSGECPNHEYLTLACPPVQDAGGLLTACDDSGLGMVDLTNISIPVNTCAEVIVRTTVDLLAPRGLPGGACNVAFYQTDSGTPDGSGQTSPPSGNSGCSCVEVLAPLPTQLDFTLAAVPDTPPLLAADASSTLVYDLNAVNLTPREARGRVLFPLPAGVDFVEIVDCPPGATCGFFAGAVDILDLVLPEGGSFAARVRVAPNCESVASPDLCAQAEFLPLEDPGAVVLSDDGLVAGLQPTCVRAAAPDLQIAKTWRLAADGDGDGLPNIGDRVRYRLEVWNAGDGAGRGVQVVDNLPLGLDAATAAVDARGSFDPARRQAAWRLDDIGPGTVIDLWLEATISGASIAPNRARLTTDVIRACSLAVVLSDDPTAGGASDATSVAPIPGASLVVAKTWTFTDLDGDGGVTAGEPVHWVLDVSNRGAGTAADARLDDALGACWGDLASVAIEPAGAGLNESTPRALAVTALGGPDGLAPDESLRVSFTLVSSDVSTCCNEATATWNAGTQTAVSSNPGALASSAGPSCLAQAEPAVRFTKSASLRDLNGNGIAEPGERLTYTLVAESAGGGVSDVILADEIPQGISLDPASLVTSPPSLGFTIHPAPAGAHGNGRIEAHGVGLSVGGEVSLTFEADIVAAASATICNVASLVVPGQSEPFLSSDALLGGATCVDVTVLDPPILGVAITAEAADATGCLMPGDEVRLQIDYSVSAGGASAAALSVEAQLPPGLSISDAGGGIPGTDVITWPLGTQPGGSAGSLVAMATLPCGPAGTASFGASVAATNAPGASAGPVSVTSQVAALSGLVDVAHADLDANGSADPGEPILVTLTLSETQACDAAEIIARLDPGPFLDVVTINDGGALAGGAVEWGLPILLASGTLSVSVELTASASAPDCSDPILTTALTWALAPPTCRDPVSLPLADTAGPRVRCVPSDPPKLLREDSVTSLHPVTPALAGLLDSAGVDDSCAGGAVTRIAPGRIFDGDVTLSLATGVVVPDDALPVGEGNPGTLVFYEVSNSCEVIRVCRVDADGDPADGRESIVVTSGTCP